MTSENINTNDTPINIDTDFPCTQCGKMLHLDMADDLEGDETYVIARNNGTGEEDTLCVDCYHKRGYKYRGRN